MGRIVCLELAKEAFQSGVDVSRKWFDILVRRVKFLEEDLERKEELARSKIEAAVQAKDRQREKLHRLREKYAALVELYNSRCEEARERSDSSSSDDEDDGKCSLM